MPPDRTNAEAPERRLPPRSRRPSGRFLPDVDVLDLTFMESDDDYSPHPARFSHSVTHSAAKEYVTHNRTGLGALQSLKSPSSKPRGSITVKGVKLKPTIVFDTFWYFAAERMAIDNRRRLGGKSPWTEDPILQKYPFCNTYRVLDKHCQYMIREVIEKGSQDPTELVFRIVLFNLFTKIETWELLRDELAPLTWARYTRDSYGAVLTAAKNAGTTLYTGAFQKPAPSFDYADAHMNHLCLLEILMENDLASRLLNAQFVADVYEYLISFPSMGEFSTYQLILNLSYSKLLNFSNLDFVIAGPGAVSGLHKMFGAQKMKDAKARMPTIEDGIMRWLAEHQDDEFRRLGIEWPGLGPDRLPMGLEDIEHLLCEVDKYSRMKHPQIKGKRTEMRRLFHPAEGVYSCKPILPKAWAHPIRKIVRIRPGGPPVVEKRYEIKRIGGHWRTGNGLEFKVYWRGYPDSDATWEPKSGLAADAPAALKEYMNKYCLKD